VELQLQKSVRQRAVVGVGRATMRSHGHVVLVEVADETHNQRVRLLVVLVDKALPAVVLHVDLQLALVVVEQPLLVLQLLGQQLQPILGLLL